MPNISQLLTERVKERPDAIAIVEPIPKRSANEKRQYKTITFRELDQDSDKIAAALIANGMQPETRIALMVKQGIDFISLVFGLFKAGATLVLIDPGMGMKQMINCLAEVDLQGFAALSPVQAVRVLLRSKFPNARLNLTVGRRWFWGGLSLAKIRQQAYSGPVCIPRNADDSAAIIFTSGSTGIAKGVHYTHGIFCTQTEEIQKRLDIQPGDIDLAGFPFFGLFNAAMGVTAVIPDMDSTRPARVDPRNVVEAVRDWNVNQSFGSPALWNRVIDYCLENNIRLETLKRTISAGAPINALMLERLQKCVSEDGEIYTPYGATEALPVSVISATEVLSETVHQTKLGKGICVGNRFPTISWKVVKITDDPIPKMDQAEECNIGEIGELVVSGSQVTTKYVTRVEANALSKITDETGRIWHRMGDVGYLDVQDRFWFCGRKAHRVETKEGPLFSIPCESIFNQHPQVSRTALVGIPIPNSPYKEPCLFIECKPNCQPANNAGKTALIDELKQLGQSQSMTAGIGQFRFSESFPVDVRHNAKINREQLAELAGRDDRDNCKVLGSQASCLLPWVLLMWYR